MNGKQRLAVIIGIALVLFMLLFPPFNTSAGTVYALLFEPSIHIYPAIGSGFIVRRETSLDVTRLIIQCLFVSLLTIGVVIALKKD